MSTPASSYSSPARRTIAILRSLCQWVGLDASPFLERLCAGFAKYGELNHLQPSFDLKAEWDAELLDVVAFAGVAVARGMVTREDPCLRVYLLAARRLVQAQKVMMEARCQQDCLLCDAPDLDSGC